MNLYAFQLGRQKNICLAELKTLLGASNLIEYASDIAIFQLEKADQALQDSLGGTIKIMEVFKQTTKDKVEEELETELLKEFADASGKIPFALNLFGLKKDFRSRPLLNHCKRVLRSIDLNCRFINNSDKNPPPSTIYVAKVIEKGIDLNLIKGAHEIYMAKSVAIQNIDEYSLRDYNKPKRDAKVGMTPPKLAQIMINFAHPAKVIYDPFCGTGTYPMEAMLMGKTAVASDIDDRMVEYTQYNCDWITTKLQSDYKKYYIFKRDARLIEKSLIPDVEIDAIVTEGYLGEPQTNEPNAEKREVIFRELANLHLNWLTKCHQILPKKGKVVMCLTAFRDGKEFHHLPNFEQLAETAGYKILESLTYGRPDQIVMRDIIVLEKI